MYCRKFILSFLILLGNSRSSKESIQADGPILCEWCKTNVPRNNYQLHEIRCKKIKEAQIVRQKDLEEKTKNAKKAKSAAKKKNKENSATKKEEEDIDALLDSFAKEVSQCTFPKCKNPIKVLGHRCDFCSQMYCTSHHMAEVHGCGDAAKMRARQDIAKYKGSMPRKMNDIKKAQVQNKLSSKLSKLEEERKKKAKENN